MVQGQRKKPKACPAYSAQEMIFIINSQMICVRMKRYGYWKIKFKKN